MDQEVTPPLRVGFSDMRANSLGDTLILTNASGDGRPLRARRARLLFMASSQPPSRVASRPVPSRPVPSPGSNCRSSLLVPLVLKLRLLLEEGRGRSKSEKVRAIKKGRKEEGLTNRRKTKSGFWLMHRPTAMHESASILNTAGYNPCLQNMWNHGRRVLLGNHDSAKTGRSGWMYIQRWLLRPVYT